jgi:hypothetical protein
MTNENPTHTGVVDPSILNVEDDLGIPTFLQRTSPEVQPVFTTQEDAEGQVELTVEEQTTDPHDLPGAEPEPSYEEEYDGMGNRLDGTGEQVLEQLAPQEIVAHSSPVDVEVDAQAHVETGEATSPGIGHNMPADPAEMRRDFFKDVNKFGKASGEGASALGRLGIRALRAAADGILSTAKPQGGGKDDATLVYEAYAAMDSKHSEHTAGGAKANASKLRQIIGMGCMTTLSDPVAIGDKVVAIRERMEGADLKPKALFAALVDTAREQLASDTELSDAAIEQCLTKTKADKTLEKEWTAIQKRVEGLITGEASHGLKDTSDTALKISDLCLERLKQYKSDGTRADLIDAMIDQGYTRAQAIAIVDKKIAI